MPERDDLGKGESRREAGDRRERHRRSRYGRHPAESEERYVREAGYGPEDYGPHGRRDRGRRAARHAGYVPDEYGEGGGYGEAWGLYGREGYGRGGSNETGYGATDYGRPPGPRYRGDVHGGPYGGEGLVRHEAGGRGREDREYFAGYEAPPGERFPTPPVHRGRGPRNYTRSDERILEDLNDRLTEHPYLDASDVEVRVHQGEVTLEGTVESRSAKRLAEDLADDVTGVRHVQNSLRVRERGR